MERTEIEAPVKSRRVRRRGDGRKRSKAWKTPLKNCDAIVKEKQNNQYLENLIANGYTANDILLALDKLYVVCVPISEDDNKHTDGKVTLLLSKPYLKRIDISHYVVAEL